MKYLFAFGCPRSGTTALGHILNRHPSIALGIERFKHIAMGGRSAEFTSDLFEQARFLDIRPEDTNTARQNEHLAQKFASGRPIRMIGDKIPRLYHRIAQLRKGFPEAQMVVIFRDPMDVALSWQARAESPRDSWPAENDGSKALAEWMSCVDIIAEAQPACGAQLKIIDYDRFFGVPSAEDLAANIKRLYTAIGLEMQQANLLRTAEAMRRPRAKRAEAKPTLTEDVAAKASALRENARFRALLESAI
jgi:hypothetical protein